jgi:hypothetical protein
LRNQTVDWRNQKRIITRIGFAPMQIGFAAEKPCLRIHRCRHLAQAIMALGRLNDRRRIIANVFPLIVSAIMVGALPDFRSILLPYPAPVAVEPASPSPYFLWASLDTKHPRYFSAGAGIQVLVESAGRSATKRRLDTVGAGRDSASSGDRNRGQ